MELALQASMDRARQVLGFDDLDEMSPSEPDYCSRMEDGAWNQRLKD